MEKETVKKGVKTALSWVNSFGSSTISTFLVASIVPPQVWLPLRISAYATGFIASWMYDEKADEFIDNKVEEIAEAIDLSKDLITEAAEEAKIEVVK